MRAAAAFRRQPIFFFHVINVRLHRSVRSAWRSDSAAAGGAEAGDGSCCAAARQFCNSNFYTSEKIRRERNAGGATVCRNISRRAARRCVWRGGKNSDAAYLHGAFGAGGYIFEARTNRISRSAETRITSRTGHYLYGADASIRETRVGGFKYYFRTNFAGARRANEHPRGGTERKRD